ncbi:SPFH domain / Band 7 family protein [Lysobacter sp. yr284]|uniref:slipin family protein n=1 Tax=Lysobacter sp. yr284 TaxID=1761791 RepID=UPI000896FA02|nr:slipin family protein [Lysobacter sp. yr284]SDZ21233.1 SPFH domain / Band 7 family protein [Lysobacter sp. yr284]
MFWTKKVVVGDAERVLVYRNRRIERVLGPGVHMLRDLRDELTLDQHNIGNSAYAGNDGEALIAGLGERLSEHFVLADIGNDEVGLVLRNGRYAEVLAPGMRRLYWKGLATIDVRALALAEGLEIEREVADGLRQIAQLDRVAAHGAVPTESAGLLFVDGKFVRVLAPGAYAFWNLRKNVAVETVELRVQAMEVSGQELLTRDKVTLRVNLAASVRVASPVAARTKVAKYAEHVYRELQYGLRKAVSSKTLDELLGDKASLDADILASARGACAEIGVDVLGVGVKDVILPGEMKDILNAVVQAEKTAQANTIRRREEANATRSLLNTAKLIEDSPVLMRLKELEALEKITEKIDKLTVFGGLEGVMKQLVSLKGHG